MDILKFDLNEKGGKFKYMNAVNNGPLHNWHRNRRTNLENFKKAGIPFVRNHDASFCAAYGGEHVVDISAIFPNFDADPYDPESYDFVFTDELIYTTLAGGSEIFYRLGQKIEHGIKKYHIFPPKDYQKWAVICEHIIRHYNEGWANGFNYNIKYWEIWNEADGAEGFENAPTWQGTREEFFEMFITAALHLKKCFTDIKIGGPSLSWNEEYAEALLNECKKRGVEIDFFSWHTYTRDPKSILPRAKLFDDILKRTGYPDAENICNEWNYLIGWVGEDYDTTFEHIHSIIGAAFTMAVMSVGQSSHLDMLMYYDAQPSCFNGIFDYYTLRPLKGYYPFLWFSKFYDMEAEIKCKTEADDIYTLCGVDNRGKTLSVITYYTAEENMPDKELKVDFGREGEYEIYLLDEEYSGELVDTTSLLQFKMKPNSCIMIKEK